MQDKVDVASRGDALGDVALPDAHARSHGEMRYVTRRSGDEIVQADHLDALVQEPLAQMYAKETGPSGNDRPPHLPHGAHPCPLLTVKLDSRGEAH